MAGFFKSRYSIRTLLVLFAGVFFTLAFHRQLAEWLVYGYWLIALVIFLWAAVKVRKPSLGSAILSLLAVLPVFLVFLYSSYFLVWVVDMRKAEWFFKLPAIEIIEDCLRYTWYLLNAFWHSRSVEAAERFNYGHGTLELQFTAVFSGLMSVGVLGHLAGRIVSPLVIRNRAGEQRLFEGSSVELP